MLDRLRQTAKDPRSADCGETQAFLQEAEKLLQSPPAKEQK
jgi:hypothetical protein